MKKISIEDHGLIARNIDPDDIYEREEAQHLRYKVFVEELGWFSPDQFKEKKESDKYDEHAVSFGVFDYLGHLVGFARFVLPNKEFMIEKEFRELVRGIQIRKDNETVEISRLAILPDLRKSREGFRVAMLLYKVLYQWSIMNGFRYWYMVVEKRYLKVLQSYGFPCQQISLIKEYQPGVSSLVAMLDLRKAEGKVKKGNPELFKWFTK